MIFVKTHIYLPGIIGIDAEFTMEPANLFSHAGLQFYKIFLLTKWAILIAQDPSFSLYRLLVEQGLFSTCLLSSRFQQHC